jgi:disulfide bond formation protein DsbB
MSTTKMSEQRSFGVMLNMLGLLGISLVLMVAFYYQLALGELPCSLCLLQRAGFIAIGIAFLFNVRIGERASHYAMILAGSFISVRQVVLHLGAGDPGYGSTLFGLHFYTWALITAVGVVGYVALVFVLKDAVGKRGAFEDTSMNELISNALFAIFALVIAANLVSTVLECGAGQCEDNPVRYLMLGTHQAVNP